MKRGFLSTGVLFLVLVGMLGTLAVGYGMWSKTLTVQGTVSTGEVNAQLSIDEVDEGEASQLHDDGINEDHEVEGKDIAECAAELLDGLSNAGPQTLRVTITDGYPSFECFVNFDVNNNGTIPVKLHLPEIIQISDGLDVHFETPIHGAGTCYFNEVNGVWDHGTPDPHPQLEPDESTYCTVHIHILQSAPQNAGGGGLDDPPPLTFEATILAHQWNEEPGP